MTLEDLQQNYADATGYVMDRTTTPPKILGLAFLVSKSRAVTCASIVSNYVDAPWAIQVSFPHPDIILGTKSIALHNDFDKRAARNWYLSQTGNYGEQLSISNDIASLVLDAQLSEMQPEAIAELNRALTLPFSSDGVDASGALAASDDMMNVIGSILQAQRHGLLTFMDPRNIPVARVQLGGGKIQKVYYRGIVGELAFFELLYRRPASGYAFQSQADFNWGEVRDIIAPTDALVQEALRRVNEVPQMIAYLGGSEARYQTRVDAIDPANISEEVRWLAERLISELDGYLTIDSLSERLFCDTYTLMQCMREFVNKGLISMINRATPFHCSGQLGTPLTSHTDFEVHAWDPLQAFYLDHLSGKPCWMQGNFFGVANALQPKNMLHTIQLPPNTSGALILKDYKLIGIHSGPQVPKPGQALPPVKCYQMMWMGALLDMTTKKLRSSEERGAASKDSLLRSTEEGTEEQAKEGAGPVPEKERLICPNCYTTNTKPGPCFNCGTIIEPPPTEAEPQGKLGKLAQSKMGQQVLDLQKKYNLTNKQMAMAGCAVVALPLMAMLSLCSGGGSSSNNSSLLAPDTKVATASAETVKLASDFAGFSGIAIPGYRYKDTMEITKPVKSFGMESEQSNVTILFLIFDDYSAVSNLKNFVNKPFYQDDIVPIDEEIGSKLTPQPPSLLGTEKLQTFIEPYVWKKDSEKQLKILVGSFPSPQGGKSILVIARALDPAQPCDLRTVQYLIDQMEIVLKNRAASTSVDEHSRVGGTIDNTTTVVKKDKPSGTGTETSTTTGTGTGTTTGAKFATDEELDKYTQTVADLVLEKLKLPDDAQELHDKKKFKKLKTTYTIRIDNDGKVTKLEQTKLADLDSVNHALTKAINGAAPFKDPPYTEANGWDIVLKYDGEKIKGERP
jgi:hypothetical protein